MLKKLTKKYGRKKLKHFLTEIHPHLTKLQKKLNQKYFRIMKFGTAPDNDENINRNYRNWATAPAGELTFYAERPDVLADELKNSIESAIPVDLMERSGSPNFINRSEIILWKHKFMEPPLRIQYKSQSTQYLAELFKLILTTILCEYEPQNRYINRIKDYNFLHFFNNATCEESSDPCIFVQGVDTDMKSADFPEIVKSELIILLMRVLDMIHDFIGERTQDKKSTSFGSVEEDIEEAQEKLKLKLEQEATTSSQYLSEFLKFLIPETIGGDRIEIKFYSFSHQRYFKISFPASLDPEFRDEGFPIIFRRFILGIQGKVPETTAMEFMKDVDKIMMDYLFHFNNITVGKNNFKLRNKMVEIFGGNGAYSKRAVLEDVPNMYQKIARLNQNTYIAPSNFTDANASTGATKITAELLKEVRGAGERLYSVKNLSQALASRALKTSTNTQDELNKITNLNDLITRQIVPEWIKNVNEKGKVSDSQGFNNPEPLGGEKLGLSVVSCYFDTMFQFVGGSDDCPYLKLEFFDAFGNAHIEIYTGITEKDYITIWEKRLRENRDPDNTEEEKFEVIHELDQSPTIPRIEITRKNVANLPSWINQLKGKDIDGVKGTKSVLEDLKKTWEANPGLGLWDGGQTYDWTKKIRDQPFPNGLPLQKAKIFEISKKLVDAGVLDANISTGFVSAYKYIRTTQTNQPKLILFTRTLALPGVAQLHAAILDINSRRTRGGLPTYIAQLTTIKFYGDSSQAQTPMRHLKPDTTGEAANKSVLVIQGDTPSTFISAIQNKILPLVTDANYRKCNVLGGNSANSGYAGLFTLPALDIVKQDTATPMFMTPPRPQQPTPGDLPPPRDLPPPKPPSRTSSSSSSDDDVPLGWEKEKKRYEGMTWYTYYKDTYIKPKNTNDWVMRKDGDDLSYWFFERTVPSYDVQAEDEKIPRHIKFHTDPIPKTSAPSAPTKTTPPRDLGEKGKPNPTTPAGAPPKKGAKSRARFGGSLTETMEMERTPSFVSGTSTLRLRGSPTEKINWKKVVTLTPMFVNIRGKVKYIRAIREKDLFRKMNITDEETMNKVRNKLSSPGDKLGGTMTLQQSRNRFYGGITAFGKRRWYVDRTAFGKLYRKQSCGCNPQWVTPQYYKKITGKSFWKLPTGAKVR